MSEQGEVPELVGDVETTDNPQPVEQQNAQVEASVKFAEYLTSRYPQVDDMRKMTVEVDDGVHVELPELPEAIQVEPQLNYYIVGSLATTLLSRAETIDLCEETTGSDIRVSRSVKNPPETRVALAQFARPIGDIDYVTTDHYDALRKHVQDSYGKVSSEDYQKGRAKYLWKGGGGPKFGEVPTDAAPALKRSANQTDEYGVMCDPVEAYGTKKFARVEIDGHDYYVARPDTIIGYKVLHMLQNYDQKPDKFNSDFVRLHQAMTGIYLEDEMVRLTHQILGEYEASMARVSSTFNNPQEPKLPAMTQNLMGKEDLGTEARSFIDKVASYDKSHGNLLGSVGARES